MSALLAAAVTFVVTANVDEVSDTDGVLSLREAVAAAEADPGPNIITFASKTIYWQPMKSALDLRPSGALTINGDVDDDGLADILLGNGLAEKLIVHTGAEVTVVGIDFLSGSAYSDAGANGINGIQGLAGTIGTKATAADPPTDGGNGADGTDATSGTNAKNVGGIIHNFGNLTLIRVGLASGYAAAGPGGLGGLGGFGGLGGNGGNANDWGSTWFAGDGYIVRDGANGGHAGHGARGGNGGNGGNAAGAILNEATGVLTLTDVTFGGRMCGWVVSDGSIANGGVGASSGKGGNGSGGGGGGEGSDQAYFQRILPTFDYIGQTFQVYGEAWVRHLRTKRGTGGTGGNGGNRGDDGTNGNGGDAASEVLNLGAMSGSAALGAEGIAKAGLGASYTAEPYIYGTGGPGGLSGFSKVDTFSYCSDISFYNHPDFTAVAVANAPDDYVLSRPPNFGITPRGAPGADGLDGADGRRAKDGKNGISKIGILSTKGGVGKVKSAASLVFIHALGVKPPLTSGDPPTLDFNIIRIGKGQVPVTIKWSMLPAKAGPSVSAGDFGKANLPSGSVMMEAIPPDSTYDYDKSVKRVSLPISLDGSVEVPEGYRIEITEVSEKSVLIGTSVISGELTDDSPKPKLGSNGSDKLTGTNNADAINGRSGNDKIYGLAGKDALYGGSGNDTLDGGADADGMVGGDGNDVFIVDNPGDEVFENWLEGTDTVQSSVNFTIDPNVENLILTGNAALTGTGNELANQIIGNKADNILSGLGGPDVLTGGDGNDVFRYLSIEDSSATSPDFISDFDLADDKIDLSLVDANTTQAGSQPFDFIGTDPFTGPGQVRFEGIDEPGTENDRTIIEANVNANHAADLRIILSGLHQITSTRILP
jgi:hypothetical protein